MPPVVPSPDQLPFFEELATPTATRARRPHLRIQPPLLADLTTRQRKAVTHGEGPLLIVAGAGTGKTTVITRRIAWLIAEKRAKPSEVLALTFTDRAADEMIERVDRLVPYGHNDAQIGTFHAFGDRLLREHAFEAGLATDRPSLGAPSRSSSCASTSSSCRLTDTARSATRRASSRRSSRSSAACATRTSARRSTPRSPTA